MQVAAAPSPLPARKECWRLAPGVDKHEDEMPLAVLYVPSGEARCVLQRPHFTSNRAQREVNAPSWGVIEHFLGLRRVEQGTSIRELVGAQAA